MELKSGGREEVLRTIKRPREVEPAPRLDPDDKWDRWALNRFPSARGIPKGWRSHFHHFS